MKLANSLFGKQIPPILVYGYPIWSPPQWQNLIVLVYQQEGTKTRKAVIKTTTEKNNMADEYPMVMLVVWTEET